MLSDLQMFGRFSAGLHRFLAHTLSASDCGQLLADSLAGREESFLRIAERAIFANPRSPYLPLLKRAGVTEASLRASVCSHGIEATLETLRDQGVWVSLDQFKGNAALEGPGFRLDLTAADFDNPLLLREFTLLSSGSTGRRRRLAVDLDLLVFEAAVQRCFLSAHGLLGRPLGLWRPTPPGSSGIKHALRSAKMGEPIARWFDLSASRAESRPASHTHAIHRHASHKPWQSSVFLRMALLQANWGRNGAEPRIPEPIPTPIDDPSPVLEWMTECQRDGKPAVLSTPASTGVRLARLALDHEVSLDGAVFWLGGEPITEAKASIIRETGATTVNGWSLSETGPLAIGCANREAIDEVHLLHSKVAFIPALGEQNADLESKRQRVLVTTLMPASPKLLLNVDIGDSVSLSQRRCGCGVEQAGFPFHAHGIRPESKLTAGGMHVTAADLLHLVEQVLPEAIGGTTLDYQFVEQEQDGVARITILVNPTVMGVSEKAVRNAIVQYLSKRSRAHAMMVDQWQKAGTLGVSREAPFVTATGKKPAIWRIHK